MCYSTVSQPCHTNQDHWSWKSQTHGRLSTLFHHHAVMGTLPNLWTKCWEPELFARLTHLYDSKSPEVHVGSVLSLQSGSWSSHPAGTQVPSCAYSGNTLMGLDSGDSEIWTRPYSGDVQHLQCCLNLSCQVRLFLRTSEFSSRNATRTPYWVYTRFAWICWARWAPKT